MIEAKSTFIARISKNDTTSIRQKISQPGLKVNDAPDGTQVPEVRERWANKLQFLLSCIGSSVGIGNLWRFPILAYEGGGAAFLLPYITLAIFLGAPFYFMEIGIGQYARISTGSLFTMLPITRGIGISMVIVCLAITVSYSVVLAYSLYYLLASLFFNLGEGLPWATCNPEWATANCFVRDIILPKCTDILTTNCTSENMQTSSEQYWQNHVTGVGNISPGLSTFGDLGGMQWPLFGCHLITWICIYFCIFKGIKSSGLIVYVTATLPYILLIVLMINTLTTEGSELGLKYFFIPKWEEILKIKVWCDAASQIFFSLGIAWGTIVLYSSYLPANNRSDIDALIIVATDSITSVVGGVVVFGTLGSLARSLHTDDISTVVKSGTGLAFIVYPEAVLSMKLCPRFFGACFFFTLITLGIDSEFAMLEVAIASFLDVFPKYKKQRPLVAGVASAFCCVLGIFMCTSRGEYVMALFDEFASTLGIITIGVFEIILILYVYGVENLSKKLSKLMGVQINIYWKICWYTTTPILVLCITIATYVIWTVPKAGGVDFPWWAVGFGWFLLAITIFPIFFFFFYSIYECYMKGDALDAFRPMAVWENHLEERMLDVSELLEEKARKRELKLSKKSKVSVEANPEESQQEPAAVDETIVPQPEQN